MNILALDLGTKTGVAWVKGGFVGSEIHDLTPGREADPLLRYDRFERMLRGMLTAEGGFDRVAYELVKGWKSTYAQEVYDGFKFTLMRVCRECETPQEGVHVGTIKKHATGMGNANKKAVVLAMRGLGWKPRDDNEADAQAILEWACEQHGIKLPERRCA